MPREIPGLPTEQTGSDNDFENGRIAWKLPDKERLILRRAAFRRRSFSFPSFEISGIGPWQATPSSLIRLFPTDPAFFNTKAEEPAHGTESDVGRFGWIFLPPAPKFSMNLKIRQAGGTGIVELQDAPRSLVRR